MMAGFAISAAVQQWTRDPAMADWARSATAEDLAAAIGLSIEQAQALRTPDLIALDRLGVHHFTFIQLSRIYRFSLGEQWARQLATTSE